MKSSDVFPSRYLKAEELDEDVALTMSHVDMEEMKTQKGEAQNKPVLYFKEIDKGLVLNKTNWSLIAKQYGDESDEWAGKPVTLTVLDVDSFGDVVSAIRIKPPRKVSANPVRVTSAAKSEADDELTKAGISRKTQPETPPQKFNMARLVFDVMTPNEWHERADQFCHDNKNWQTKDGKPDLNHVLASAGQAGYEVINADNINDMFDDIVTMHEAKAQR